MLTPQGWLKNGIVSINSKGLITDVGTSDSIDSVAGLERYSGILIPGMVNAHSHLELSYLRGEIDRLTGFAGFASCLSQIRTSFSDAQRFGAIDYWDAYMWHQGIDAVGDICNGDSCVEVKSRSRIEYVNFLELFGLGCDSASSLDHLMESCQKAGLRCNLTPHSTYSLNQKTFSDVIQRAQRQIPISIHFMETRGELELFESRGELSEWYRSRDLKIDFLSDRTPAQRIINHISADQKVLLVHNTCIRREDAERLLDHFGDNLTWVLCPLSNDYISGGMVDLDLLTSVGGRIALGTDSLASNSSLCLVSEMKALQAKVPLDKLVQWASLGGAEALGLEERLGSIERGKSSGLVLLSDCNLETRELTGTSSSKRI